MTRRHKGGDQTLAALRPIRAARPYGAPINVIMDNLSANKTRAVRRWARHKVEAQFGPLRTFVMGASNHPNHPVLTRRLQDYLRWRNANARHPDVLTGHGRSTRPHSQRTPTPLGTTEGALARRTYMVNALVGRAADTPSANLIHGHRHIFCRAASATQQSADGRARDV